MFDNIDKIYENYLKMMGGRIKRAAYIENMSKFRNDFGADFAQMLETVNNAENKDAKAEEIGKEFSLRVFQLFEKRGKVKTSKKVELNMFSIYYIFPAILLTQNEDAKLLCDKLCEAWNNQFSEKIGYADFDTIASGFNDKIFGLF